MQQCVDDNMCIQ